MKGSEAIRKLNSLGWTWIKHTGRDHDMWRSPEGGLHTFSLKHGSHVHREAVMTIRKAERAASARDQRSDLMTTTSVDEIQRAIGMLPDPEPSMKVYRSRDGAPYPAFADLFFGETEARHLGWPDGKVQIDQDPHNRWWRLRRGGTLTIGADKTSGSFRVRLTALADAIPPTARANLPVERCADGFILHTDRVVPVPPEAVSAKTAAAAKEQWRLATASQRRPMTEASAARMSPALVEALERGVEPVIASGTAQEPRQTVPEPAPAAAPAKVSPPAGGAPAAPQSASPQKKPTSIDDLRAALDMLRGTLAELGITMYTPGGEPIDLSTVVVRVTL